MRNYKVKKCEVCFKMFKPTTGTTKVCSDACRKTYQKTYNTTHKTLDRKDVKYFDGIAIRTTDALTADEQQIV